LLQWLRRNPGDPQDVGDDLLITSRARATPHDCRLLLCAGDDPVSVTMPVGCWCSVTQRWNDTTRAIVESAVLAVTAGTGTQHLTAQAFLLIEAVTNLGGGLNGIESVLGQWLVS
jgi:hypothetical protein